MLAHNVKLISTNEPALGRKWSKNESKYGENWNILVKWRSSWTETANNILESQLNSMRNILNQFQTTVDLSWVKFYVINLI